MKTVQFKEGDYKKYEKEPDMIYYKTLKDLNVVFDVGSYFDYAKWLLINPSMELHAFDPHISFQVVGTFFNNFGLGNENKMLPFNSKVQRISVSKQGKTDRFFYSDKEIEIRKGSEYVKKYDINKIDYLKIDTESWDFEVIKGFEDYIDICRYVQVEYGWKVYGYDNTFEDILKFFEEKGWSNEIIPDKNPPGIYSVNYVFKNNKL